MNDESLMQLLNRINGVGKDITEGKASIPSRTRTISILKEILSVLLPEYYSFHGLSQQEAFTCARGELLAEIRNALCFTGEKEREADDLADAFLLALPEIKRLILTDVQAIYDGDPAAKTCAEVILCYPGFFAISIYRIAHVLYVLRVPYISRIMTEYAHEKTGIDINPGAVIGEYFCIDHGTGIVIGETATLGHHVKLYQGVTIGAKSFEKDAQGHPVKGGKRHPDIGNGVVIYANATILGGDTRIGDSAVIGGSVWLTSSVEPNARVYYKMPEGRHPGTRH